MIPNGDVVAAALLVHIGRGQVNDNLFARNMETPGLQGRHRPQETLLDGGIGQAYQVDPDSQLDIDLDSYGYGFDAHALGAMDVNQHIIRFLQR